VNQQGRVHFSSADIGGELLPILTRGLYSDILDSLREYIQNAIDARATKISVSIDPDVVTISDDGVGMDAVEARRAIRLGISEKNPQVNVGFRGIGTYSGFNLCESLEIFTKSAKENTIYRLFFNFSQIRRELMAEQERRNQGNPPGLYLERLLEESVFVEPTDEIVIVDQGTRVIMSGLLPDAYRRINDWDQVENYLQNVVPLPFNPEFKYGSILEEKFEEEDYRVVPLTLQMGDKSQSLYRPYTDSIFRFGGMHPPEFFDLRDTRTSFGFAWVCMNDARETIKDTKVRGLLIKKFGFSIGDRQYLEPFFGRTVYSRRITGEIIIKHPNLIPNAARSDFENNSVRQILLESLPKLTGAVDTWANNIQEIDRALEVLSELLGELGDINRELPSIQRDRERLLTLNARLAEIERRLKPHYRRLESAAKANLDQARELLSGAQRFVREALVSQRRSRRHIETEVVKAVQREALRPSAEVEARNESIPVDLLTLMDSYGIVDSEELRRVLQFLDDNILKAHLDRDECWQPAKVGHFC
jgi:hypothetical protein